MRIRIGSLAPALACACLAAPCGQAVAAPLGFAIEAAGFKSYFTFATRAPGVVRGHLVLIGLTPGEKTILLRPVDVGTASTGGLQYGTETPGGDGRWLELGRSKVRLTGSASVPFTLHVPRDASAGEHFAGIAAVDERVLAARTRSSGSVRLRLIPRLAMTVQATVPGRLTRGLAVGRAAVSVAPSGATVALPLSSTGNALIEETRGEIVVSQNGATLWRQLVDLGPFVPRTTIRYAVPWEGMPAEGSYRVRGVLRPQGARAVSFDQTVSFGGGAIQRYRRETGRPALSGSQVPATLIAALAAAVVAALGFAAAYARLRRRVAPPARER